MNKVISRIIATTFVGLLSSQAEVQFNLDIKPILADACFHCHGPDPGSRKAGLRLDTEQGLFEGDPPPIDKNDLAASEILYRLTTDDEDDAMPPPENHRQLDPKEISLIQQWVKEGASWEPHWSFNVPEKSEALRVKKSDWVRNPIDQLVLSRLEAEGLEPAEQADARTLVRRLSLDLTGLPPSPETVEAFAKNPTEAAYQALIDSMLKSTGYGEHRARYWLDAARYGDTHGLHFDNYREMWPYRDWVVSAFNRNQPFDEFTVEQLAGDLLDKPTREQLVATGFQRCNITTNEGGTIVEENLANYAADRVQTVGWVFMGLTTNCAQCHDHKFDPITAKDYYAMAAFFRNTTQGGLDGNVKDGRGPAMTVPTTKDAARWDALPSEIAQAKKLQKERRQVARKDYRQWLESSTTDMLEADLPKQGLVLHRPLDPAPEIKDGKGISLGKEGDFEADQAFTSSLWVNPRNVKQNVSVLARMDVNAKHRGWDIYQSGKRLSAHLIHEWPNAAIKVTTRDEVLQPNTWKHVTLTWDGSSKAGGITLMVDGKKQKLRISNKSLKSNQSVRTESPLVIGRRSTGATFRGKVQDVRLYNRVLSGSEISSLAKLGPILKLLAIPAKDRSKEQDGQLFEHYLKTADAVYRGRTKALAELEQERDAIASRSPITHVQKEKEGPAMGNILMRGQYDNVGEEVTANTPEALVAMPEDAPRNRLGLAQWLVSPENPLTGRVTVNRFWQELFGQGLVITAEDFGIMGAPPSHPELLDWLAVSFVESGWDVKALFKDIVRSSTYRQSARTNPAKLEKDPHNVLLSRGPRFRMDAEMVRDYALAASDTLSTKIGGPSTRPYQPEGVWDVVGLPGGDTRNYVQDKGENLYRRTLYNFWKRMAPHPNLEAFNAPSREVCTVRRERTNTPLQALVTLNDPQFVEAARRLAEKALTNTSTDDEALAHLVKRVLLRQLRPAETGILKSSLTDLLTFYENEPEKAKALIAVGDAPATESISPSKLAAWTMLANQVLNLDETLNK
jgi:hypothetical protein